VAFDETQPQGPDSQTLPLPLYRRDFSVWRANLLRAAKEHVGWRASDSHPEIDEWLTQKMGCNKWVKARTAVENVAHSRCHVGSVVELASKPSGWRPDKVFAFDGGDLVIDEDLIKVLGNRAHEASRQERENYALRSLKEDLTDEPWLELNLRKVSHQLVRMVADSFEQVDSASDPRRHLFETGFIVYPHSVVVHMVLLTADGYMIIGHRSFRPRFYENCWATTYEEHMKVSEDGPNPFTSAVRGLREELVGRDPDVIPSSSVRLCSVFRELDYWENAERKEAFWDINVGLAGIVRVPLSANEIFANWKVAIDRREFRHLVAIPYTFHNVLALACADTFNPLAFSDELLVPDAVDRSFPDMDANPGWRRQHPTDKIRLARCLTADFLIELRQRVNQ
jgi:hypothetical protein